jgi:hypothetical protein
MDSHRRVQLIKPGAVHPTTRVKNGEQGLALEIFLRPLVHQMDLARSFSVRYLRLRKDPARNQVIPNVSSIASTWVDLKSAEIDCRCWKAAWKRVQ